MCEVWVGERRGEGCGGVWVGGRACQGGGEDLVGCVCKRWVRGYDSVWVRRDEMVC